MDNMKRFRVMLRVVVVVAVVVCCCRQLYVAAVNCTLPPSGCMCARLVSEFVNRGSVSLKQLCVACGVASPHTGGGGLHPRALQAQAKPRSL
jgi:hypothetical protein